MQDKNIKGLRIGNVKIDSPFFLAPMSAVNCLPFRVLCRRAGAGLIYSQMINVDDFFGNEKKIIERYADFIREERPVAAQIIGANPEKMALAAGILQDNVDIIDINFGCCDGDQLGKKAGCYFIKHPEMIRKTVKSIVESVNIPVTAKIRIGWDDTSINAVEVAKIIEEAGASAIAVHARTRKQKFTGKARWEYIKKVKDAVKIPVIGNGDVTSPESAKAMLEKTGCDAVMIARAAIGDPDIFRRIKNYVEEEKIQAYQDIKEKYKTFLDFLELYKIQPRQKFPEIRNHAIWFVKRLRGARKLKEKILACPDIDSIKKVFLQKIKEEYGE